MLRTVEIRNLTNNSIDDFPNHVISPMGRLILPIAEYIDIATNNDIEQYPVRVTFPDVDLRVVSVREFGAKGDGVSDDTYAIQSAIDSVASYGGGVVNLPVGVYLISSLTLHGNVSLKGDSIVASVLRQKNDIDQAAVSVSGGQCVISDLRIKCALEYEPIVKTSLIDGFMSPKINNDVGWETDQIYSTWTPDGTWYRYAAGTIKRTSYGVRFTYPNGVSSGLVMPFVNESAIEVGDTVTLKMRYRCSTDIYNGANALYLLSNPVPNSSQQISGLTFVGDRVWHDFELTWTAVQGSGAVGPFDAVLVGWANMPEGTWIDVMDGSAILTKEA